MNDIKKLGVLLDFIDDDNVVSLGCQYLLQASGMPSKCFVVIVAQKIDPEGASTSRKAISYLMY
jgi:hypothetical protein